MEVVMDKLSEANNRLNRILKVIQQPGIEMDHAKGLYNESVTLLKNVEELKGDIICQLSAKEKAVFADIRQKEHKLHSIYSRIMNEQAREVEKKKLHDNKKALMIATGVASLALFMMLFKLFLK